jgi:hypothetical protein
MGIASRCRSDVGDARSLAGLICVGLLGIPFYAWHSKCVQEIQYSGVGSFASSFPYQIAPLGVLYLIGAWIAYRYRPVESKTAGLYAILVFAVLYRLLLIPAPPLLSSDMYRYIWDGRVQAHGINPYLYPPGDETLRNLRDEAVFTRINRQSSPTIYPAGAQILFRALNMLKIDNVLTFKAAVVLFDLCSVLVLMMILSSLGLPRERVLIYAWHPLVIYELAGSGHLEGFMLFFVLLSLLLMMRKRSSASVFCLAVAASLKLYPVIMLPALLREKKLRGLMLFSMIFLLIYLPYMGAGSKVVGFLPQYLVNSHEEFNLGLRNYLLDLFPGVHHLVFTAVFAAILLCVAGLVWARQKDPVSALRSSYYLVSLQIVLTAASLHPWYVIWIIPFLAFFPSPAWFYLSFAVCLSYLAYGSPGEILPGWVRHTEYIPFFLLFAVELLVLHKSGGGRFPWRFRERDQTSISHGVE